jgi:FkbM family methyltransferase
MARRVLPKSVRSNLLAAYHGWDMLPLACDAETLLHLHRLQCSTSRWARGQSAVPLRLRPLAGAPVHVRPHSADIFAVRDALLNRYHLPPGQANGRAVRLIWDLGANIGVTAAHLAVVFPAARVTAVEMDGGNADLCRVNLARWSERCEVVQAAVWPSDGEVEYAWDARDEQSFRAQAAGPAYDPAMRRVPAISLNSLLEREGPGAVVDLVKMDIEGAEQQVLSEHVAWAQRVRSIAVEVHEPYDVERCRHDLDALGFRTTIDDRHWAAVVGVRD